jgi:hypothetical protein
MKWRRDRNGGASTADGYACSDRIAENSTARGQIFGVPRGRFHLL